MTVQALNRVSADFFSVVFDNGEEIRASLNVVADLRIYSGKDLSDEEYQHFLAANRRSTSHSAALEILSRRPMISKKEMHDKLLRKGFDPDTAEDCCLWLEQNRFIDDSVYAAAVVRHFCAKGYGASRIRAELSRRGVSRDLWDEAMENMSDNSDKLQSYISRHLSDPSDRKQVAKVSNALYRRGYSWAQIRQALENASSDLSSDEIEVELD